jgi:hypothetical protein
MAALPGLAALNILGHQATGQTISNTVHVFDIGLNNPPDVPTLQGLADEFWTWIAATYLATVHSSSTVDQVTSKQVMDPLIKQSPLEAAHIVNLPGTHAPAGTQAPNSLCGVLAIKTQLASRRGRGHLFLPPAVASTAFSGDILNQADPYYTNCVAFATRLQAGCGPSQTWTGSHLSQWQLCIYSRAAALLAQPSVAQATACVVKPKAYWLRSRSHGGT